MKDSLKNKLQIQYEKSSQEVPNILWERIEEELNEIKSERKHHLFNYKWASLAAIFLLFITLGFINYFNSNAKIEQKKIPILTAKIIKPNIENSSEKNIENDNVSRGELALQKPNGEKVESTVVKFSSEKSLNKINIKDNVTAIKSSDSQSIAKNLVLEKPTTVIPKKEIKENIKYTSAKDLLFGYELEKTNSEMQKSHSKLGISEIKKPKEITILGIKVYSEDSGNE
jgi:hypothetical protein